MRRPALRPPGSRCVERSATLGKAARFWPPAFAEMTTGRYGNVSPRWDVWPCPERCAARSVGYTLRVLAVTGEARVAAASRRDGTCRHARNVAPQEASATRCASHRPYGRRPCGHCAARVVAVTAGGRVAAASRRDGTCRHARNVAPQEASATRCASGHPASFAVTAAGRVVVAPRGSLPLRPEAV